MFSIDIVPISPKNKIHTFWQILNPYYPTCISCFLICIDPIFNTKFPFHVFLDRDWTHIQDCQTYWTNFQDLPVPAFSRLSQFLEVPNFTISKIIFSKRMSDLSWTILSDFGVSKNKNNGCGSHGHFQTSRIMKIKVFKFSQHEYKKLLVGNKAE